MQQHIDVVIQYVLFHERSEQCVHIELLHHSISSIIGLWCNIVYLQKQEASYDPLGEMKIFFFACLCVKNAAGRLEGKMELTIQKLSKTWIGIDSNMSHAGTRMKNTHQLHSSMLVLES